MNRPISVRKVFEDAVDLYKKNFLFLVFVYFLVELVDRSYSPDKIDKSLFLYFGVSSVIFIFLYSVATVYLDFRRKNKNVDILEVLKQTSQRFSPVIINGILFLALLILGFLALIVPGVLVLGYFGQVYYFILLEKKGPLEAFGLSRALTKGNIRKILIVFALSMILGFVLQAFSSLDKNLNSLLVIISGSLASAINYSLWRNLRAASSMK